MKCQPSTISGWFIWQDVGVSALNVNKIGTWAQRIICLLAVVFSDKQLGTVYCGSYIDSTATPSDRVVVELLECSHLGYLVNITLALHVVPLKVIRNSTILDWCSQKSNANFQTEFRGC